MLSCRYGSAWHVLPSAPPHWIVLSRTLSFKHKEKTNETIFSCKHVFFFFFNILKTGLKRVNILLKFNLKTGQNIIIWKCWKQILTIATDNRSAYLCVFTLSSAELWALRAGFRGRKDWGSNDSISFDHLFFSSKYSHKVSASFISLYLSFHICKVEIKKYFHLHDYYEH